MTILFTAATVTVPINDEPAEPAVIDAVTEEPVATVNEFASWKATTGCVVKAVALTAPLAVVIVPILVTAPAPNVSVWVATVRPVAVNVMVYEPAGPVIPSPLNVTTPFTAATVTDPINDEPADPAVMEAVTEALVETAKEFASWKATTGCVVNANPLTAPAAFVELTILVAAAAPNVIVCVATVRPVAVNVMV